MVEPPAERRTASVRIAGRRREIDLDDLTDGLGYLGVLLAFGVSVLPALGVDTGALVFVPGVVAAAIAVAVSLAARQRIGRPWRLRASAMLATVALALVLGLSASPRLTPDGAVRMSGGCPDDAYMVYGQNVWEPLGAKIMSSPSREALQLGSVAPNKLVYVDGWVETAPGQPLNSAPWNSSIWFHLHDDSGWVSFAGLRAVPTVNDPTKGFGDGGQPPTVVASCRAALR